MLGVLLLVLSGAATVGAAEPPPPPRLLLLGDSLLAGYGLPRSDAFPARLAAALKVEGIPATLVEAGVSGDTTAGGLARLPWVLGPSAAQQPDAVLVELGGNDMLRGFPPNITEANLDRILTILGERRIPVLLAGMRAAPNLGADYVNAFDAIFPRLAEKHNVALYPFFLDGVAGNPDLNQSDGIHPNAAGVTVIVERILPSVRTLLNRAVTAAARPD
ncbi:MAG: arylesterase [Rhodospirillales bacterium]|nr:arylesterase [Rhodospirillales bacterium]